MSKHHKNCSKDPILGNFTLTVHPNEAAPTIQSYGNITFHKDGTLAAQNTGALGQQTDAPVPFFETFASGSWKRVSKRGYKIYFFLAAVTAPSTPPYSPLGWVGVTADVALSKDKQSISITNAVARLYALTDPTFSNPTVLAHGHAEGSRITFDTFQ